jgi:hypothetical protein
MSGPGPEGPHADSNMQQHNNVVRFISLIDAIFFIILTCFFKQKHTNAGPRSGYSKTGADSISSRKKNEEPWYDIKEALFLHLKTGI